MEKRKANKTYLAHFSPLDGESGTVCRGRLFVSLETRKALSAIYSLNACRKMASTSGVKCI